MSAIEAPSRDRPQAAARRERDWSARLRSEPSARTAFLCLLGMVVLSTLLRAALATRVHAPTVFSDELGYEKLAESIGRSGRLALFNNGGLSYSPLYPLLLSPIYALGASAPTAYSLIKIVNAILISLAIFPTYKIARFALPRRYSLMVAGLGVVAPLMVYPSFTMSENLSYPLCLAAIWALLETVRAPSIRADAYLVVAILLASVARAQLVVLVPAAATALVLGAVLGRDAGEGLGAALRRLVREHRLLVGALGAVALVAAVAASAGHDVLSAFGRYANVGRRGFPNLGHFLDLLIRHVAGVDLAVGVVPFVAALVVALAFVRSRWKREYVPFAVVAVSVVSWLLLEVAFDAALFDGPGGDLPRIHERFLIYVIPFFFTALFAAYRLPERRAPYRMYLAAGGVATLLPLAIPFHTVVNPTIAVDSLALHPFAQTAHGKLTAISHASLYAIWFAGTLSLLYARVRHRLRAIVVVTLVPLIGISMIAQSRIEDGGNFARALLPATSDWVDQVHPAGSVVLVSGREPNTPELETAYGNFAISRLYYVCRPAVGPEFGEQQATIDRSRRLRGPSGLVTSAYVVGPSSLRLRGRIVARNEKGREVLVAPPGGKVGVSSAKRAERCG
jgi:hypothetical protein